MAYGVFFLTLAIGLILLALQRGGLVLLLIWPGVSFGLVGAAYLGAGAGIFGKRDDGRLEWWAILLFPYLFLSWLIWYASRWSGEDCWNEIIPGLFLGRRALARELPPDVGLIVDLTAEFAEPRGVVIGRTYLCLPTLDSRIPDDEAAFRAVIERTANWQGNVYIHCALGHGRSGATTMAVLLARGQAFTIKEASDMVRRARPGVRLKPVQRQLLERLFPENKS